MKPRSMWPREHGAYVQLLTPTLVALAIAPSIAGALLAIAAGAAFLAHEPFLVLRGGRGHRARVDHGERAQARLVLCLVIAGVAGISGIVRAPEVVAVAGVVGIAAAVVLALSWQDRAHTLGGELAAATTLAGAAAPVGAAGGLSTSLALSLWLAWALAFASTVVAVHVVIASHKRRATPARWLLWSTLLVAAGAGVLVSLATLPIWLAAVAVTAVRPPATALRRVGVLLAVMSAASGVWLVATAGAP